MPEVLAEPAGRHVDGSLVAPPTRVETRALTPTAAGVALIAAAGLAWTAVVGAIAIWRHHQFLSHRFDLGNMVQAVWSTTQGRPLDMTDAASGEQIVRLAAHVDPILVLFAPLWLLYPAEETLIVAYAAVIASGVYPVVRLALKHTESRLAAGLLGAWYLTIPWTVWLALNELNPVSLSLPLLLYAIWFLDEQRYGRFAVAATLALATGELIGLTVAALGVWYAVARGRVRAGATIALAGAGWTAVCLAVIVPSLNDGESSRFYNRFESVGGSPTGLLETLVTDPGTVISQMTSTGDFRYLMWLALPTALVIVAQPLVLLVALPQLGLNLLSDFPSTVSPVYRFTAPVLAVLVAATAMAIGRFPRRARAWVAAVPLLAAAVLLAAVPPRPNTEKYLFPALDTAQRRAAMREAVDLVPEGAPVTVTNRLGAHLSARRIVHLFPAQTGAEWAVLDTRDPSNSAPWFGDVPFEDWLAALREDPAWELVFQREGVLVFRLDAVRAA